MAKSSKTQTNAVPSVAPALDLGVPGINQQTLEVTRALREQQRAAGSAATPISVSREEVQAGSVHVSSRVSSGGNRGPSPDWSQIADAVIRDGQTINPHFQRELEDYEIADGTMYPGVRSGTWRCINRVEFRLLAKGSQFKDWMRLGMDDERSAKGLLQDGKLLTAAVGAYETGRAGRFNPQVYLFTFGDFLRLLAELQRPENTVRQGSINPMCEQEYCYNVGSDGKGQWRTVPDRATGEVTNKPRGITLLIPGITGGLVDSLGTPIQWGPDNHRVFMDQVALEMLRGLLDDGEFSTRMYFEALTGGVPGIVTDLDDVRLAHMCSVYRRSGMQDSRLSLGRPWLRLPGYLRPDGTPVYDNHTIGINFLPDYAQQHGKQLSYAQARANLAGVRVTTQELYAGQYPSGGAGNSGTTVRAMTIAAPGSVVPSPAPTALTVPSGSDTQATANLDELPVDELDF